VTFQGARRTGEKINNKKGGIKKRGKFSVPVCRGNRPGQLGGWVKKKVFKKRGG